MSCVEKFLSGIGTIELSIARTTTTLFLSNNSLKELSGLLQFGSLRVLSLSNNLIESVESISVLGRLSELSILSLEGNPVCAIPNYRAQVIVALPALRLLDNVEVTQRERADARGVVKKQETMMNLMVSNHALIVSLERGLSRIRMHSELRAVMFGRMSILNRADLPEAVSFDPNRIVAQIGGHPAVASSRAVMERELIAEVRRVWAVRTSRPGKKPTGSEMWDLCFSEVMLAQQNAIAILLTEIEEEKSVVAAQAAKHQHFDPRGTIGRLRAEEDEQATRARVERENLISEYRSALGDLKSDIHTMEISAAGGGAAAGGAGGDHSAAGSPGHRSLERFEKLTATAGRLAVGATSSSAAPTPRVLFAPTRSSLSTTLPPQQREDAGEDRIVVPRRGSQGYNASTPSGAATMTTPAPVQQPPMRFTGGGSGGGVPAMRHASAPPSSASGAAAATTATTAHSTTTAHAHHHQNHQNHQNPPLPRLPNSSLVTLLQDYRSASAARRAPSPAPASRQRSPSPARPGPYTSGGGGGSHAAGDVVDSLKEEIDLRVKVEAQLHATNEQLREKLAMYEGSVGGKVVLSNDDLAALNDDVNALVERSNRLQQELVDARDERERVAFEHARELEAARTEAEGRARALQEDIAELERQAREAEAEAREQERVRAALEADALAARAQAQAAADEAAYVRAKASEYSDELRTLLVAEEQEGVARAHYLSALLGRAFRAMRAGAERLAGLRRAENEIAARVRRRQALEALARWRQVRACEVRFREHRRARARAAARAFFYRLRAAAAAAREARRLARAKALRAARGCFALWRGAAAQSAAVRDLALRALESRAARATRAAFDLWRERARAWALVDAAPAHASLQLAVRHHAAHLARTHLAAWRAVLRGPECMAKRAAGEFARRHALSRSLALWREAHAVEARRGRDAQLAAERDRRVTLTRFLGLWRGAREGLSAAASRADALSERLAVGLKRRAVSAWREALSRAKRLAALSDRARLGTLRAALGSWTEFARMERVHRHLEGVAAGALARSGQRAVARAFDAWGHALRRARAVSRAEAAVAGAHRRGLEARGFAAWLAALGSKVGERARREAAGALALRDRVGELEGRARAADVEQLGLIDRLQALAEDNNRMRQALAERDLEVAKLQDAGKTLKAEAERSSSSAREWESHYLALQHSLAEASERSAHEAVEGALERQARDFEAQRRLSEKEAALEEHRRASEEKLREAYEIAAALRRLVEDKDAHIRELQTTVSSLESHLRDVQVQYSSTTLGTADQVEIRDRRIKELQDANLDLMRRNDEMARSLAAREGDVKAMLLEAKHAKYQDVIGAQHYKSLHQSGSAVQVPFSVMEDSHHQQQQQQQHLGSHRTAVATTPRRAGNESHYVTNANSGSGNGSASMLSPDSDDLQRRIALMQAKLDGLQSGQRDQRD